MPEDIRLNISDGNADRPATSRTLNSVAATTIESSTLNEPPALMRSGDQLGEYKLVGEKPIGRGGFGEVWRAEEIMTGVRCALKVVRKGMAAGVELRGIRDYRVHSKGHPHLVQVFHVGNTDSHLYYVMELADSYPTASDNAYVPRSLASDLARRHRVPTNEAIPVILNVLDGLRHLHECGLWHRDVKPANVLLVNGVWKLADIGLVVIGEQRENNAGTPAYAPPEGIEDRTGDLYAVGKTLFELVTGMPPARFPSIPCDLTSSERLRIAPLNAIIDRACDPQASLRFQTADNMRRAIERCVKRSPSRVWAVSIGLLAVAIVFLAFTLFRNVAFNASQSHQTGDVAGLQVYRGASSDFDRMLTGDEVRVRASLSSEYEPIAVWIDASGHVRDLTGYWEIHRSSSGRQYMIVIPSNGRAFPLTEPPGTEVVVLVGSKHAAANVDSVNRLLPTSAPPPLWENRRYRVTNGEIVVEGEHRGLGEPARSSTDELRRYLGDLDRSLRTQFEYVEILAFRHVHAGDVRDPTEAP